MRKSALQLILVSLIVASTAASCGKSECKKYIDQFCSDDKSPACAAAREKTKEWSANQCRIELNQLQIDEQSKRLEDELK
jgi:hypothetical protein